ncbi:MULTISPECIES: PfkB family carbohydrate kinase [Prochlorococcus]|uniref:ADP-heptose synthase n=1 Tax=Prochlorococcus marinus (strain SARG / CCMP1375 / SS120) TaxID=167539 RepID=Q7VAY1_PROMA|nr:MULTISPECIES: PfkB family carbohydrate kinase [Prochlorococcus]AAQ00366.1 ADP-heptose synthase [Prochlorococcus marinus subsp. marinus str. CCMP1375]KGG14246.1 ADP-heptose synthase [Prochlorococcus marinus str. LG]KGG22181.1 ADP-heptose synthase [Prochlorococcus marinus str. SS2]KGG24501.1 ADP-heptose synthase [Prochlorococcus marinus str. SS35]KGG33396.1 ADP-heptose synthase [Prochlorococcus marinus str. SS51]
MNTNQSSICPVIELDHAEEYIGSVVGYGHFNSVHTGHIRYLKHAKELGQKFVVAIQKHLSGDPRTHFSQLERAEGVAQLAIADAVILLPDNNLKKCLQKLNPKYLVLGKEYENSNINYIKDSIEYLKDEGKEVKYHAGDINYASSDLLISSESEIKFKREEQFMDALKRQKITKNDIITTGESIKNSRLIVIGDSIVDQYTACEPLGMSAEAPVIVVKEMEQKNFIGGAAIVASHIASLGAKCDFLSVIGKDDSGQWLQKKLEEQSVNTYLIEDSTRPTTFKKRYVVENQKLFRVSRLDDHHINRNCTDKIIKKLWALAPKANGIVVSDFVYGVITPQILKEIHKVAKAHDLKLFGDLQCSSQVGDISKMKNFTLLCPNEREARVSLQDKQSGLDAVCQKLMSETRSKNMIMKLGADGFIAYSKNKNGSLRIQAFPALSVNPVDVTGAGDSLLAIMAAGMCSDRPLMEVAALSCCGASLVVESMGNQPVTLECITQKVIKINPF